MNLYQNYHKDPNPMRQDEIDICNSFNKTLEGVKFHQLEGRPTFNFVFNLTTDHEIHIIANNDILFTNVAINQINEIYKNHPKNLCLALTRWDVYENGLPIFMNRADSQDVWVFYGKVPQIKRANFKIGGIGGCDNKIAKLIECSGYRVVNPSKDIKTYHLHSSNVRYWTDADVIPLPYKFVEPCTIAEID